MKCNIISYNCRGLPKCNALLRSRPDLDLVFNGENKIVCLQETWYGKQDLEKLNCLTPRYRGIGVSTTDYGDNIVRGHPPGGVAILWHSDFDPHVSKIDFGLGSDLDWLVGVKVSLHGREFVILNVYLPYQSQDNENEYIEKIANLESIVNDLPNTSVTILGDFNADIKKQSSLFKSHYERFVQSSEMIPSSDVILPEDTFTFVSSAWSTTSWLDHVVSSSDFHDSITNIKVLYDVSMEDHIPLNVEIEPILIPQINIPHNTPSASLSGISWENLTKNQIHHYTTVTDAGLRAIDFSGESLACEDPNCKSQAHRDEIDRVYFQVVECLVKGSSSLVSRKGATRHNRPGWSEYVKDSYNDSKEAFNLWKENGRPRQGPIHEIYIRARAKFKLALRFIKAHENECKRESMAKKLSSKSSAKFWKEVNKSTKTNIPLPTSIDEISGDEQIAGFWRDKRCIFREQGSVR